MVDKASASLSNNCFAAIDAPIDWRTRFPKSPFCINDSPLPAERSVTELLVKGLRTRIVLRGTNVYKHPAVLECVHSLVKDARKYVSLEARRALGDVSEDRAIKNIDTGVNESGHVHAVFFRKASHLGARIDSDRAISSCILHGHDRHGCQRVVLTVHTNQLPQLD